MMFIFCIQNIYNWKFSIFIPVTTLIKVSQSLNLAAFFISRTNFQGHRKSVSCLIKSFLPSTVRLCAKNKSRTTEFCVGELYRNLPSHSFHLNRMIQCLLYTKTYISSGAHLERKSNSLHIEKRIEQKLYRRMLTQCNNETLCLT